MSMQDKILWYEEILAQDSASPVFYNVAQLYLELGEEEKAVEHLRSGLDRNPAHAQARLLLIQVLGFLDRPEQARQYMGPVLDSLGSCVYFWTLWARELEDQGCTDLAAAVRFVGASLETGPLTWGEVVQSGIQTVRLRGASRGEPAEQAGQALVQEDDPDSGQAQAREESPGRDEGLSPAPEGSRQRGGEDDLPPGGYRTVTMADILAGQGELEAALNIYTQLLAQESGQERRRQLEDRIRGVQKRLQTVPGPGAEDISPGREQSQQAGDLQAEASNGRTAGEEDAQGEGPGQNRQELLRRLDRLAARLEARA
jgi:tetratricopeptide (TPR) repeat protein